MSNSGCERTCGTGEVEKPVVCTYSRHVDTVYSIGALSFFDFIFIVSIRQPQCEEEEKEEVCVCAVCSRLPVVAILRRTVVHRTVLRSTQYEVLV